MIEDQQRYRDALAQYLVSEKDTRPYADTYHRGFSVPGGVSGYNNAPVTSNSDYRYMIPSIAGGSAWGFLHDIMQGKSVTDQEIKDAASDAAGAAMTGAFAAPRPTNAVGSAGGRLFHGSPRGDITELRASERGPLGPGVYTTPSEYVAKRYAGPDGKMYQVADEAIDVFNGAGHRTDEQYFGHKSDVARLSAVLTPDERAKVGSLIDQMWASDGYPVYQRMRIALGGGDEAAQNVFKRAGFKGIAAQVDGPETLLFDSPAITTADINLFANPKHASAAASAEHIAKSAARDEPPGIRAYHGSPHDFDKFDLSKIGTGEGAQAFGHGLYFAENEGTAKYYRDALAGSAYKAMDSAKLDAQGLADITGFRPEAIQYAKSILSQHDGRVGEATKLLSELHLQKGDALAKEAGDVLRAMGPSWKDVQPGKMYEVNIKADPNDFLDWDRPLKDQSGSVKEFIDSRLKDGQIRWDGTRARDSVTGEIVGRVLSSVKGGGFAVESPFANRKARFPTQQEALDHFNATFPTNYWDEIRNGKNGSYLAERLAAEGEGNSALRDNGIPGIKYLDQGSRANAFVVDLETSKGPYQHDNPGFSSRAEAEAYAKTKQSEGFKANVRDVGSRNYVVFDDSIVEILRKYGLAGLFAGMGAMGANQPGEAQ